MRVEAQSGKNIPFPPYLMRVLLNGFLKDILTISKMAEASILDIDKSFNFPAKNHLKQLAYVQICSFISLNSND